MKRGYNNINVDENLYKDGIEKMLDIQDVLSLSFSPFSHTLWPVSRCRWSVKGCALLLGLLFTRGEWMMEEGETRRGAGCNPGGRHGFTIEMEKAERERETKKRKTDGTLSILQVCECTECYDQCHHYSRSRVEPSVWNPGDQKCLSVFSQCVCSIYKAYSQITQSAVHPEV